ncbi:hypothetical protein Pcinc_023066 [Petrolisthes cinctipes]|uniref:Uncharacterized protein n=1 Tax=Petrolisthes cinctipes TaxID=88211 RepID=A0AAE1FF35_PETCI|nr:hypothetical protein Pcinc_023066 [Petrolisthes cinctipes]
MTSVVSSKPGGTDGLNVTQGEEALELVVQEDLNNSSDTTQLSVNGESVASENMDTSPTTTSESALQSPDSAIGSTPNSTPVFTPEREQGPEILPKSAGGLDREKPKAEGDTGVMDAVIIKIKEKEMEENTNTPESPQNISVDSKHVAGDRLSEDGYEEDDEGEDEETEEDSLSSTEMVVSASMQFPLGQKPTLKGVEVGKDGKQEEDASRKGEDATAATPEEGVTVQVNSSSHLLMTEGSPSGSESDVEDNDDDDDDDPSSSSQPAPAQPLLGSPSRVPSSVVLPETVTRLDTPHGSAVFLVGTAHFSRQSQDDVAETIRTVKPDIVVVELCKARTAILQLDEETILQESRSLDFKKMRMIVRQHGKIQGVLYLMLLSVSAHITKQLGMAPGGEFRTAFAEARRSAPGCLIQLGDRPIQVTLSRALASLSLWHKIKLTWHILTSKEPISKEEVEKCKQRDFIEEMLAEMTGQFPAISEVFVKERDLYLCRSLQAAAQPVPNPLSPTGMSPRVVVGVVGIGHVPGIVDHWGKVTDADIAPIMRIPPPSLSSKLMKVGVRVTMYICHLPLAQTMAEVKTVAQTSTTMVKEEDTKERENILGMEPSHHTQAKTQHSGEVGGGCGTCTHRSIQHSHPHSNCDAVRCETKTVSEKREMDAMKRVMCEKGHNEAVKQMSENVTMECEGLDDDEVTKDEGVKRLKKKVTMFSSRNNDFVDSCIPECTPHLGLGKHTQNVSSTNSKCSHRKEAHIKHSVFGDMTSENIDLPQIRGKSSLPVSIEYNKLLTASPPHPRDNFVSDGTSSELVGNVDRKGLIQLTPDLQEVSAREGVTNVENKPKRMRLCGRNTGEGQKVEKLSMEVQGRVKEQGMKRQVEVEEHKSDGPIQGEDEYEHVSSGLVYIETSFPGMGLNQEEIDGDMLAGCECVDGVCGVRCTCFGLHSPPYVRGRLVADHKLRPIFECNDECSCGNTCPNRLAQKGPITSLKIEPVSSKGYGVTTSRFIPSHSFVCEYAGEIISTEEAQRRFSHQSPEESNYILVLREHITTSQKPDSILTIIDPTVIGNIGRYINHSCDPNLMVVPVRINSFIPLAVLFACRDIEPGEELSYDYGGDMARPHRVSAAASYENFSDMKGQEKLDEPQLPGSLVKTRAGIGQPSATVVFGTKQPSSTESYVSGPGDKLLESQKEFQHVDFARSKPRGGICQHLMTTNTSASQVHSSTPPVSSSLHVVEIASDYGENSGMSSQIGSMKQMNALEGHSNSLGSKQKRCLCGAKNCRGFLPSCDVLMK